MIRTIGECMTCCPVTIEGDMSLLSAQTLMQKHGVRHLPVLSRGRPIGIVCEHHAYDHVALHGGNAADVLVTAAMMDVPFVVAKHTPLHEVVAEMARGNHETGLVLEGAVVVGIFTTLDALHARLGPRGTAP